jgi:hypothetical protein
MRYIENSTMVNKNGMPHSTPQLLTCLTISTRRKRIMKNFYQQLKKHPLSIVCVYAVFLVMPSLAFSKAIIADHTAFHKFTNIPAHWIERAKELTIHYAHTSHGDQVYQGLENLEAHYPLQFSFARRKNIVEGLPPVEDPPALRMYDGNPLETYIMPDDYWNSENGRIRTRGVANTGKYNFSMWAWCGQVSGASAAYIQDYLGTLNDFETQYPDMRFIYMTGHLDGSGSGGNLHVRNEQIRNYCIANNKVLFDFADIERYNPDGADFLDLGADDECQYSGGNWADEWCAANPGSELCDPCTCSHSKPLNCNMKARVFWWLMTRLAGWNGAPATVPYFLLLSE